MREQHAAELRLFGIMLFCGMALYLLYDLLRIGRRIRKRGVFAVSVQDFLFWFVAGIVVFCLLLRYNYGIVRVYALGGVVVGACLYHLTFGRFFVSLGTKIVLLFHFPVEKGLKFLKKQFKLNIIHRKNVLCDHTNKSRDNKD